MANSSIFSELMVDSRFINETGQSPSSAAIQKATGQEDSTGFISNVSDLRNKYPDFWKGFERSIAETIMNNMRRSTRRLKEIKSKY